MEENRTPQWEDDDEIELLDLIIVLAKRKRLIAGLTLIAAVLTAAISLFMKPVFRAEAAILPPQTYSSIAAQMLSQLGAASSLLYAVPSGKAPGDLYVELLKSRTVLDRMVERFDLMKRYETKTREEARRSFAEMVTVKNSLKSGIITVGVEDTNPEKASAMANGLVEELKNLTRGLSITEASQRRLFFEEQLKDARESLLGAEEAMKTFQEKSGAVKIDAQADAVIQGISSLRAQIAAKEVQIRVMRTYSTKRNPDLIMAEEELRGMQDQLSRLEGKGSGGDSIVPTGDIPQASTEYLRRMRDLKFSETLYELLFGQYQAAKIDESREASVIQVVENAVPPETRVKPRRTLMVVLAAFAGLFVGILAAFVMEYRENASRDPESREKLTALKRYLSLR